MEQKLRNLEKSLFFCESILNEFIKRNDLELEHKIVIALYRKLLEQTHGGYILVVNNLDGPLKIMERSAFETYLSLMYILQKKESIKDRASSYYFGFLKDLQKATNDWIKHTELDTQFIEEVDRNSQSISSILDSPKFKEVSNEWEKNWKRVNKKRWKGTEINPKWHSLFKGKDSINKLAKSLMTKDPAIQSYYGALSQEAHGYNSLKSTNYLNLINEPLSLKPIFYPVPSYSLDVINAFCIRALDYIIAYWIPERRETFTEFLIEIGMETEMDI